MTALEAQWSPVRHLILGDDPQLRLYAEISVWYKKLELFRKREDDRMVLHEPTPEDLAIHKSLAIALRSWQNLMSGLPPQGSKSG